MCGVKYWWKIKIVKIKKWKQKSSNEIIQFNRSSLNFQIPLIISKLIQKSVQSRCSIHSLQNKIQCSTSFSSKFGFFISDASKINRRSCKVAGEEGTCMFVWECLKTDGKHLGMCMDGFMFGSCCVHNEAQNTVLDNKVKDKPGKEYCVAFVSKFKKTNSCYYFSFLSLQY